MTTITPLAGHGGARIRGGGAATVGRGVTYIHKRLKRDRPDLLERVVSGELSANAAAVEAGFRKRPSAFDRLCTAWAQATPKERKAFLAKERLDGRRAFRRASGSPVQRMANRSAQ